VHWWVLVHCGCCISSNPFVLDPSFALLIMGFFFNVEVFLIPPTAEFKKKKKKKSSGLGNPFQYAKIIPVKYIKIFFYSKKVQL
jgi:hypothetical protein